LKRAFTLIELIMVISIVGILAIVAVPNMMRSQITAKESAAQGSTRIIAAALENFATVNNNTYPTAENQLTGATPAYLNQSYCSRTVGGYFYDCTLNATSYTVTATPSSCGGTGGLIFTVTTGGNMTSVKCP
jgi:general secretion pathway protein G